MKILSRLNTLQQNNAIQKVKRTVRFLLGIPLTLLSIYFLTLTIWYQRESIIHNITQANIFLLLIGLLLFCVFFFLKTYIWHKLLPTGLSELTKTFYDYQLSEIARYAPLNVLSFISRMNKFETKTITKSTLLKLMGIELIILVLGAFIVSIPSLLYLTKKHTSIPNVEFNSILMGIAIIILLWMFARPLLGKLVYFLKAYFTLILISIVSWLSYGLGAYFIAISFAFLNPIHFAYFLSLFTLGWLIGFLSFVVPMGIGGVREFVIIFGLAGFVSLPLATSIVVMQRVLFTVSEALDLGLISCITKNSAMKHVVHKLEAYRIEVSLALLTILYICYFSFVSIKKHNNFFTGRYDLGNMDQTVWNTLNGRIFQFTNPDSVETVSRLSAHADFILILLAPFYALWSDPRMLLIIQSFVLGIGALFVYGISNFVLKNKYASLVFAISYTLNPFVQRQNLYDFHAVTLATTFILASFYFLLKKRFVLFSIFLLLTVLTKEHMYLIAFFFGAYVFIKGYKKAGLFLSASSLIIFYLLMQKFIPDARGGLHFALSYYQKLGDSPFEIARSFFTNPITTFEHIATVENVRFIHTLFSSVGYLVLFAPYYLVFAAADFAISILSTNTNLKSVHYHYGAAIIPFIYISAIYGFKRVLSSKMITPKIATLYVLVCSLITTWAIGVLPGSQYPQIDAFTRRLSYREDIYRFIASVPPDARVATTNNIGAHFSQIEHLYTIPKGIDKADVIVFLITDSYSQPSPEELRTLADSIAQNPTYRQVIHIKDFRVFVKRSIALEFTNSIAVGKIQK